MSEMKSFRLDPTKRVLFLTKDPDLIRQQIAGELNLTLDDVSVEELLDDINTDVMTPAWVCFDWQPTEIAKNAYAGLIVDGERLIPEGALYNGGFEVIVSGYQKGVGSSRETAAQAEKYSGIRLAVAASFAPIHARNNINSGVLMADHAQLADARRAVERGADERIGLGLANAGGQHAVREVRAFADGAHPLALVVEAPAGRRARCACLTRS